MLSTSTRAGTLEDVATVTTRPYHHGNLRAALLEQAERTLAERGALSLRELARELGVSHAAPRRHFADKQALLDALTESGFDRLGRELDAAIAGAAADFTARLTSLACAYVDFATQRAALLELMFAAKERPDAAAGVRAAADRAFAAPLALFHEAQAVGEVVPGDPKRVATVAWACFQGLAAMANGGMLEAGSLDDVVADAVDRLVHGMRPR
jgi:AcrR family transcriptional regulator